MDEGSFVGARSSGRTAPKPEESVNGIPITLGAGAQRSRPALGMARRWNCNGTSPIQIVVLGVSDHRPGGGIEVSLNQGHAERVQMEPVQGMNALHQFVLDGHWATGRRFTQTSIRSQKWDAPG